MNEHEQKALTKIREAYISSKPVIEEILREHQRAIAMLSMFRSACILSPQGKPEEMEPLLNYFNSIEKHMNTMVGVLTTMHGVAMFVNAIMGEHEEEST